MGFQVRRMRCSEEGRLRVVLSPGGKRDKRTLALGLADENGEATAGGDKAGGGGECLVELLDRAHGDQAGALGDGLGAGVEDGKAGEMEGPADLAEEGRFLAVAFDEGELQLRGPILDGQAGKAGAAAEVEDVLLGVAGEERAGGEERLAEMADDHLLGGAQGGEVHALVPAGEQVEVDADGGQQRVIEFGGGDEGREQVSQGGGFHGE